MMDPKLKKEIKDLEDKKSGEIDAETLYEAAKKPGTALHEHGKRYGVWDKDKAQHHWGVTVFGRLFTQWRVEVETTEIDVVWRPQYVRNPAKEYHDKGMVSFDKLRTDKDLQRDALIPYLQRAIGNLETGLALSEGLNYDEDFSSLITGAKELIAKIKKSPKGRKPKKEAAERARLSV
jgi:hypothetical protein